MVINVKAKKGLRRLWILTVISVARRLPLISIKHWSLSKPYFVARGGMIVSVGRS
ncbi:MAG: hypothetical protein NWE92_00425 [Candidatus Bathyarchaeota archaeon]|nr:hypothetical protein [Candidatus Bathyarchaeota archaeon]